MAEHHYNAKLDIPSDADSARFFVPAGYTARLKEGVLVVEPEESEGEKIRKEIVSFIRAFWVDHKDSVPQTSKWLDWLEKQKEQKPAIVKPHKGDGGNPYDMGVSEAQDYAINRGFGIPFNDGEVFVDERYITQTIGNILRWADEHPKEQKPEWSDEDELMRTAVIQTLETLGGRGTTEMQIDWMKSLRPKSHKWYIKKGHWYMCIVDKPEYGWTKGKVYQSPEDNRIETDYKGDLSNWPDIEPWFRPATCDEIPDNQSHWKPSEEQMRCLRGVVQDVNKKSLMSTTGYSPAAVLQSLYIDLKALM